MRQRQASLILFLLLGGQAYGASLSLRVCGEVHPGWAMTAVAVVRGPLEIQASAAKVRLVAKDGKTVEIKLVPAARKEPSLGLKAGEEASIGWYAMPEDTAGLAEGDYRLIAEVPGGKAEFPFHVSSAPDGPEKPLALAGALLFAGRLDDALRVLDELPAHPFALELKGDVLAGQGKPKEAVKAYRAALDLSGEEPPRGLTRKYQRALAAAMKG